MFDGFALHQKAKIGGRAESVTIANPFQRNTPALIALAQLGDSLGGIAAMRHPCGQITRRDRYGRREQDRFDHPLLLLKRRRWEIGRIGGLADFGVILVTIGQIGHVGLRRMVIGEKVSSCRISSLPSLASSSVAAKVAAVAERRRASCPSHPSGRKSDRSV